MDDSFVLLEEQRAIEVCRILFFMRKSVRVYTQYSGGLHFWDFETTNLTRVIPVSRPRRFVCLFSKIRSGRLAWHLTQAGA